MIEELVTSIIDAEKKADEIVKDSNQRAKNILIDAENKAGDIMKDCTKAIHDELARVEAESKGLAEEEYSEIIFVAHNKCKELEDMAKKNEKEAIKFISGRLSGKYAGR